MRSRLLLALTARFTALARLRSARSRVPALLPLLLVPLLPSVAAAGWGDEKWGEMVWGSAPPAVPALPEGGLIALAALLALAGAALLRARSHSRAAGRRLAWALAAALIATPGSASATAISLPYSFSNGTIADADQVNANFDALLAESNAQDGRIGTLETDLGAHEGDPSAHHAKTTDASELTSGTLPDARLGPLVSLLGQSIETGELSFDPVTETELASALAGFVTQGDLATHAGDPGAHHARYGDAEALAAVAAADAYVLNSGDTVNGALTVDVGPGGGSALTGISGNASTAYPTYGVSGGAQGTQNKYAGWFSAGAQTTPGAAFGVYSIAHGTTSKYGGYFRAGDFGTTTGEATGVVASAYSSDSEQTAGSFYAGTEGGSAVAYGVDAEAHGTNEKYGGRFVAGNSSTPTSGDSVGVSAEAYGTSTNRSSRFIAGSDAAVGMAYGVDAEAHGTNTKYGGHFVAGSPTTSGTSYGVQSYAYSSTGSQFGGHFTAGSSTTSGSAIGVRASAASGSGNEYGGYFDADGSTTGFSYGVYADGGDYGVYGHSTATGVAAAGQSCDFDARGVGTNYCSNSSRRWKENVEPIGDALAMVERLRGVYFDWDAEHGGAHDVGMIAEEVGEVLPEIVVYEANGVDAISMDYSKLTPLLVEALKSLAEENRALRQEIVEENRALKQQVAELAARLEAVASTDAARVEQASAF